MDAFLALADPNRRRMLEMLADGDHSAGEIADRFAISAPAVSQHLKTLREARLVEVEVRGQQRIYSLARDGFKEVDNWLARNARFWHHHLNQLESVLADVAKESSNAPPVKKEKSRPKKRRKS